jgi:hypothetical protein
VQETSHILLRKSLGALGQQLLLLLRITISEMKDKEHERRWPRRSGGAAGAGAAERNGPAPVRQSFQSVEWRRKVCTVFGSPESPAAVVDKSELLW